MSQAAAHVHPESSGAPADGPVACMIAEFNTPEELKAAAQRVREKGFTRWDAHSPFPVHGIDGAMGIRATILPWIIMAGGVTGCLTGLFLQWYANAVTIEGLPTFVQGYAYLISGKPYFSLPANIPVIFELTVLFSAITAVIAMLALNNLPLFHNPLTRSDTFRRATTDGFFISVEARDPRFGKDTEAFLRSLGGVRVETIHHDANPGRSPKWIVGAVATVITLAMIPPAIIWKAWFATSEEPRIHIIQDMDAQPKAKAQRASTMFADHRAMRTPVESSQTIPLGRTVARGELRDDDHFYRGIVNGEFATSLPTYRPEIVVDDKFLQEGRERFDIYCAVCHGRDGSGNGMVNVRAQELGGVWVPPANLHDAPIRERPVGYIFNTITHGIRTMPPYGSQILEADRWKIVAYVRALQRSQAATIEDVPQDKRAQMR